MPDPSHHQNPDLRQVRNLIFDLGAVLYRINFSLTHEALSQLDKRGGEFQAYTRDIQHDLFKQYETGRIDEIFFLEGLRDLFGIDAPDEAIIAAWNALLIGVPEGMLPLVKTLSQQYHTAVLSNTNRLHFECLLPETQPVFDCIEQVFTSYELGMRKPEPETYLEVVNRMGWQPAETLMIDDSPLNLDGAKQAGLQTLWVQDEQDFMHKAALLVAPSVAVS